MRRETNREVGQAWHEHVLHSPPFFLRAFVGNFVANFVESVPRRITETDRQSFRQRFRQRSTMSRSVLECGRPLPLWRFFKGAVDNASSHRSAAFRPLQLTTTHDFGI